MDRTMLKEMMAKIKKMDQTDKKMLRMIRGLKRRGQEMRRKLKSLIREKENGVQEKQDVVNECSDGVDMIAQANDRFSVDLYRLVQYQKSTCRSICRQRNVIVSAYSVSTVLTMLAVGAKNKTQDEIIQALHLWPYVSYPSHRRNHPRKKG